MGAAAVPAREVMNVLLLVIVPERAIVSPGFTLVSAEVNWAAVVQVKVVASRHGLAPAASNNVNHAHGLTRRRARGIRKAFIGSGF